MDYAKGESLKVGFDRSIKLEFHGAKMTSDIVTIEDQQEVIC